MNEKTKEKILPCDISEKLIESGSNEKLAYAVGSIYDSLICEYGEKYENIILSAILSAKYEIAKDHRVLANGKKSKLKEDVKAVLKRNNFSLDFVTKKDLENKFIYASYPIIENGEIREIKRIIVMPEYFNDESPASIGMLVNSINTLVKSYVNEYKIENNTIIRRRGLATYSYDINSKKLLDSKGFGLEEGLNSYDEMKIVRKYFDQDEKYDLEKPNDNVLVAGMLMDGEIENV